MSARGPQLNRSSPGACQDLLGTGTARRNAGIRCSASCTAGPRPRRAFGCVVLPKFILIGEPKYKMCFQNYFLLNLVTKSLLTSLYFLLIFFIFHDGTADHIKDMKLIYGKTKPVNVNIFLYFLSK